MSASVALPSHAARVGLTGGIASGKTTVSDLFAGLGVPVIDTDLIAREVVAAGSALRTQLFARFGAAIRGPDGELDRSALGRIVFADPERRRELEALLHPAIRLRTEELARQSGGPYQLHVVPLLVETGSARQYARVLVVDCPEGLQLQRLRARSQLTEAEARAMLKAQA
ncbi:MAG: dephospho-CoA kinase, partial [Steroidobacteraceae bacterium]